MIYILALHVHGCDKMDIGSIIIFGMAGLAAVTIIYDFIKMDNKKSSNLPPTVLPPNVIIFKEINIDEPNIQSQLTQPITDTTDNRSNFTYSPYISECKDKVNEIRSIMNDFDYSDRNTYEKSCSEYEKSLSEIENGLPNFIDKQTVDRINNLIDEINRTYKNAYNKKNNVSSLSYIMETEEDIDLIKKININDFK